jgi:hypothetical protein
MYLIELERFGFGSDMKLIEPEKYGFQMIEKGSFLFNVLITGTWTTGETGTALTTPAFQVPPGITNNTDGS